MVYFSSTEMVHIILLKVALDCKAGMTKNYLKNFEPFIGDDTAFPKMQVYDK